jgi:hypothetical protein
VEVILIKHLTCLTPLKVSNTYGVSLVVNRSDQHKVSLTTMVELYFL